MHHSDSSIMVPNSFKVTPVRRLFEKQGLDKQLLKTIDLTSKVLEKFVSARLTDHLENSDLDCL